jgi:hypothetical protein
MQKSGTCRFGFGYNSLGAIISLVVWSLVIGEIVSLVGCFVRNANITTGASSDSAIEIAKSPSYVTTWRIEQSKAG